MLSIKITFNFMRWLNMLLSKFHLTQHMKYSHYYFINISKNNCHIINKKYHYRGLFFYHYYAVFLLNYKNTPKIVILNFIIGCHQSSDKHIKTKIY